MELSVVPKGCHPKEVDGSSGSGNRGGYADDVTGGEGGLVVEDDGEIVPVATAVGVAVKRVD